MKVNRKIIEIDEDLCDGCGLCVPSCAEGALEIVDGKVKVIADNYCDGLGACLGECPVGALKVVDREAEEFDEVAVEAYLEEKEKNMPKAEPMVSGGCPSSRIERFDRIEPVQASNAPDIGRVEETSALSHWPVQIRLIPPTAEFLKGADLLVLADCMPVAFPSLHRDFLKEKVVALGCPKFDDAEGYVNKFAEIFQVADIKSVTVVVMEVPCCAGLPIIVKKGLEISGKEVPIKEVVVSTRGKILDR
ncbi:MAG: 4Fe-4S binding protein [Desulfobacterales bacterium]